MDRTAEKCSHAKALCNVTLGQESGLLMPCAVRFVESAAEGNRSGFENR